MRTPIRSVARWFSHRSCTLEILESRRLLSTTTPTANEQYMLELTNRARANPTAEAKLFHIDLNEGLPAKPISATAKQPLAFNSDLIDAARSHSDFMLSSGLFQHDGPGTTTPFQRDQLAGYVFNPPSAQGENIAWEGTTGTLDTTSTTTDEHSNLFIDSNTADRGHRINIEFDAYKEIGIGIKTGTFKGYHALMTTQDFAYTGSASFLTGVAYNDTVKADHFYTPGEGLGGVTITATPVGGGTALTTTTWAAGGYTLALPAGTYHVTASGGTLASAIDGGNVTIGALNVAVDFTPGSTAAAPTAALSAKTLKKVQTSYSFTVTYSGPAVINSTFGNKDILVTGPAGYHQYARFISASSTGGGTTRKAIYRIKSTGSRFRASNNGTYHVYVRTGKIGDANGNFVAAANIGLFKIRIA